MRTMGTYKRPDSVIPWVPGFRYGGLLPALSINLIVADTQRSAAFHSDVFEAEVHYQDVDFTAVRFGVAEVMLHADHTHDGHSGHPRRASGATRGIGAQFRMLGIEPDATESRARQHAAHVSVPTANEGHGWRELLAHDPVGYEWAIGILIEPAMGPTPSQPVPPAF